MLVATFGPATGWQGREIIWDVDHFILVGHGAVAAAAVMDYDRQGFLTWASPEMPAWVQSVAQWQTGGQSAGGARPAGAAQPAGASKPSGKFPTWAIVVIVLGVAAVVLAILMAILIPMFVLRTGETLANDAAVRSGARNIQVGIESWAAEHGGVYPQPSDVNSVGLSRYITAWPNNPYIELPMSPGTGPGCYRYEVSSGGGTYRLTVFGRDGTVLLELTGGGGGTV